MMERGKINEDVVERLVNWIHSGFNVYTSDEIPPYDIPARERASHYLTKPCISLEKMSYDSTEGKIVYGEPHNAKVYDDPLDFLALISCHITERWEHRVIPYGFCLPSKGGQISQEG